MSVFPQLTEAWAAAYTHVLIILFIFVLGFSALLFETTVPEDIRRVRFALGGGGWWFVVLVLAATAPLLFVWFLHPGAQPFGRTGSYLGAAVLTAVVVGSVALAIWQVLRCRRDRLVSSLLRSLKRQYRRSATVAEPTLQLLGYLGQQGVAGSEKQLVLDAIDDLARYVQAARGYRGSGLASVIHVVERTLRIVGRAGDDADFLRAGEVLSAIRRRGHTCSDESNDAHVAVRGLGSLCARAMQTVSDDTAENLLEALQDASDQVLEFGVLALRCGRNPLAIAALSRLDTIATGDSVSSAAAERDLLALLAHFWTAGNAARAIALHFVELRREFLHPSLTDAVVAASTFFRETSADFGAADRLDRMLADLAPSRPQQFKSDVG